MSLTITRPTIPVPLPLARGGTDATTPAGARAKLELGDLALLTAPGGTSTFLRADKTWTVPPGGGGGAPTDAEYITSTANGTLSAERVLTDTATITWDRTTAGQIKAHAIGGGYTDEQAQDAVGTILADTATIDFTYTDATPSISASVVDSSITEAKLSLSDVTTQDASTTAHGLLRKLSGTPTQYLDGTGAWTTPAGSGGESYWSRVDLGNSSLASTILAFWPLEEATGNRLDSVSGLALVPTGTTAQVSNGPGKIGQALAMDGTAGTYLSMADNATFSAGPNQSFTVACWVYVADTGSNMGFVGKGSAAVSSNNVEYLLWQYAGGWHFEVGSGASFLNGTSSFTPVANQWCLLIGWYDHVAGLQYIQVNNGTPVSLTNTVGSFDSTFPFEVGRTPGFAAQSLNGRIDMVAFDKRVWTPAERDAYWNGGAGLAYPFTLPSRLSPATIGDQVLLAATPLTQERLEVDGALKLGTAVGTVDGTLRWSGTDFEGCKGGAWVSMTSGGGGATTETRVETLAVYNVTQTGTVTQAAHWTADTQTTNTLWWRVPTAYAGGDVTLTILRRAEATGGTALMPLLAFRLRDNTAASEAILTQTVNFTPIDTLTHALTVTLLAADVTIGDVIRVDLGRDGAHASDTLGLVLYDGASVAYTAALTLTGGGGSIPGGSATQAQYNNAGVLAGSSGLLLSATHVTSIAFADPSAARTALGLGTLSTLSSVGTPELTNDAVTYAKLQNCTDARLLGRSAGSAGDVQELTVGTGLSLSAGVLSNTVVAGQPLDATLTALAGLATGADQLPYATGTDTFAQTPLTAFARTLLDDTTQAAMRTTLALTPGTDVQAQDAELQALAGLASAADRVPYFTGTGTAALATFTAAGRTLVGAADATAQRTALGLGTLAVQNANAVAITGGAVTGLTSFTTTVGGTGYFGGEVGIGTAPVASQALTTNTLPTVLNGPLVVNTTPGAVGSWVIIRETRGGRWGITFLTDSDGGGTGPCRFLNAANGEVGFIATSATATTYATTSDVRLKHSITALTGTLDVLAALRPVRFRWNADDSAGVGFLAHELQQVVPEAVTGEPDAVDAQGNVVPQGVDHSRLVPWLTAALQATMEQVAQLTARVGSLEQQLGL